MTVQDPNFWKRFSVAVHQDDAAKYQDTVEDPNLKHAYVISLAEMPSPSTPTSQTHMHPHHHPQPPSPVLLPPHSPAAHASSQPPSPPSPETRSLKKARTNSNFFGRHGNASQMTLGLSGRPQSRFKFWTSITADPANRDSWLEAQQRKRRHRTWVCWGFWLCLLFLIGAVVAAVLVLRSKHII